MRTMVENLTRTMVGSKQKLIDCANTDWKSDESKQSKDRVVEMESVITCNKSMTKRKKSSKKGMF